MMYICNPSKNTECKKTSCQTECFMTTHKEFSDDGTPIDESITHVTRREANEKVEPQEKEK